MEPVTLLGSRSRFHLTRLRDVVIDRQIRLLRDRNVIEPGELFFGCGSTVASALSLKGDKNSPPAQNIVNRGRGKGRVEQAGRRWRRFVQILGI